MMDFFLVTQKWRHQTRRGAFFEIAPKMNLPLTTTGGRAAALCHPTYQLEQ